MHFEFKLHVAVGWQQPGEWLQYFVVVRPVAIGLRESRPLHFVVQATDEVVEDVGIIARI